MGLRQWMRHYGAGDSKRDAGGRKEKEAERAPEEEREWRDRPPAHTLARAAFYDDAERPPRPLGEFDADSYPEDLTELVRRRQQVAARLLEIGVTDRESRRENVEEIKALLRTYPHPLAYEALIHAYLDLGRPDEAKGVAFAARERRAEVARSPHPEIRAEIDRLNVWTVEEVQEMWEERQKAKR